MAAPRAVRIPVATLIAVALMGIFFSLLAALIDRRPINAPKQMPSIVFTRLIHDEPTEPPRPKPVPKELPPQVAVALPRVQFAPVDVPLRPVRPQVELGGPIDNPRIDDGPRPIYRPDPVYPRRLQLRGIEGWVQLKFDIAASGAVTHVAVIDADPKGSFDTVAKTAVSQWKYEPMVKDGRKVMQRDVAVVLRFVLEDSRSTIEDVAQRTP
jgi:periplasmic protein TonB